MWLHTNLYGYKELADKLLAQLWKLMRAKGAHALYSLRWRISHINGQPGSSLCQYIGVRRKTIGDNRKADHVRDHKHRGMLPDELREKQQKCTWIDFEWTLKQDREVDRKSLCLSIIYISTRSVCRKLAPPSSRGSKRIHVTSHENLATAKTRDAIKIHKAYVRNPPFTMIVGWSMDALKISR